MGRKKWARQQSEGESHCQPDFYACQMASNALKTVGWRWVVVRYSSGILNAVEALCAA